MDSKKIVESWSFANDAAERCVKPISDFLSLARNEENFQNYLQVGLYNQVVIPDLPKKGKFNELKVKHWYCNYLVLLCISE